MKQVVNDQNFNDILNSGKPLVLDFSATWCGPCKKVAAIIEEIAPTYEEQIIIGLCDVDENFELTKKYGIRNVPTVLFIKDQEVVDKQVGAASKDIFVQKIENIINK